jgi:hypothetical protein
MPLVTAEVFAEGGAGTPKGKAGNAEFTVIAQDPSVRPSDGRIRTATLLVPQAPLEPGPAQHGFTSSTTA